MVSSYGGNVKTQKITVSEIDSILEKQGRIQGIYEITEDDYHALKFVSSSLLKDIYKTGLKAAEAFFSAKPSNKKYHKYSNGTELSNLGFGSIFHALILEPQEFQRTCRIMPKLTNKKEQDDYKQEMSEFILINEKDSNALLTMEANLIQYNTFWNTATSIGHPELAVFWVDQLTGLQCKAKFDFYSPEFGVIDLKTTSGKSDYQSMQKTIEDYNYDLQAFHYLQGLRATFENYKDAFTFVFVEKCWPYDSGNISFSKREEEKLLSCYLDIMKALKNAISSNNYGLRDKHVYSYSSSCKKVFYG